MKKLWGSRFESGTSKLADQFSYSISYDYRLAKYDVIGSIAHAKMLGKNKIITAKDSAEIVGGLQKILKQIESNQFKFDPQAEDIHTNIQTALKKLIGEAADKLHTARSRNDLIVLDMKLYALDQGRDILHCISDLQRAIVEFADKNKNVVIPAYTHLQGAQVVLLAHHMLAYVEMLRRDYDRLVSALKRMNTLPLGSCALSGTTLPIDRAYVATQLGFDLPSANSMDSVSDRDFLIDMLSNLAILGMHVSRIAEDLILWSTSEFKFVTIDWAFCTGSSIMPHKKNPDILELIRGESANLYGNLNKLLILTKGLPLTYNRDLQLDKPPFFESIDKVKLILPLLADLFSSLKINPAAIEKRIHDETLFSVDLMEYLIKKGVSYRQAHDTIGRMVKDCLDRGEKLSELTKEELKKYSKSFEIDVKKLFNPQTSVTMKQSFGSTNPKLVHQQLDKWKKILA